MDPEAVPLNPNITIASTFLSRSSLPANHKKDATSLHYHGCHCSFHLLLHLCLHDWGCIPQNLKHPKTKPNDPKLKTRKSTPYTQKKPPEPEILCAGSPCWRQSLRIRGRWLADGRLPCSMNSIGSRGGLAFRGLGVLRIFGFRRGLYRVGWTFPE